MRIFKNIVYIGLLFSFLVLGMESCSTTDETESSIDSGFTDIPIEFEFEIADSSVVDLTRGSKTSFSKFTEYGIIGRLPTGVTPFATNILYKKDEQGVWKANKVISWPKTAANFYAINGSFTTKAKGGIVDKVTMTKATQSFDYTIPESTEDQIDLMMASTYDVTKETNNKKVKLSFKRVLGFINFTIVNRLADENYILTVGGISLHNMISNGTFKFTTAGKGTWTTGSTRGVSTRLFDEPFLVPRTSTPLVHKDSVMFAIPQAKTTKWATSATNTVPISVADENGHTYVKLLCKIQDEGGNYVFGSATNWGISYAPVLVTKLSTGSTVTLAISFTGGYDENGLPLSFGSGFEIMAEDWDETPSADPIEVEF